MFDDTVDVTRLKDVEHYSQINDIIFLGMMYENRAMMEGFCAGISWKKGRL